MNSDEHRFQQRRIASFLELSRREHASALLLVSNELPQQAAFFAQQSVEKLIRAVIECEALKAGPTHNLRELIGMLGGNHHLRASFIEHQDLSSSATRYRYPLGGGGLSEVKDTDELKLEIDRIASLRMSVITYLKTKEFSES
jgi:HEPN domain-containing protein